MNLLRRLSLTHWLVLGTVFGIGLGLTAPDFSVSLHVVSDVFLRLIRAIIAPVLFGVLVRAIGSAGSLGDLGRLGWKSVVCFEVATTLALLLGWIAALITQPGSGVTLEAGTVATRELTFATVVTNAFPTSIIDAMARGDVLQIIVFCFIFGLACLSVGTKAGPVLQFADSLAEISFRFTHFVMLLAPVAVLAAMAVTTAQGGLDNLAGLAVFFGSAWVAEILFLIVVLGGGLVAFRVPLARFVQHAREPFLIAFATTSSAAALPRTLEVLEQFGVPRRILGVVAPLSLSLNLNGSTLYLSLATLFVAQAAQVELTIGQQVLLLFTLKITSKGIAGIPRANFVVLAAIFQEFGLPLSALTMLIGIDALIDPIRTSVNVVSHCAAPVVVARWEGVTFDDRPTIERTRGS